MSGRDVLHGVPGEFAVVRCDSCRHFYMNPRPADESLGDCYPDDYGCHTPPPAAAPAAAPRPWYASAGGAVGLRPLYRWLCDKRSLVLPEGRGRRAVEVGCGRGDFLVRLREAGWHARGVDLVPAAAETARSRGFEVHRGTLSDAVLTPGSHDAVFGWMVLEHVADPRGFLGAAFDALRPGGELHVSVPDFGAIERRVFGNDWLGLELPRHLQHFTPASVRRLLGAAGFEGVRVVHQRSAFYLVASLGLRLRRLGLSAAGDRLLAFVDSPSVRGELLLAPLAKVLGWTRQSGRMTVSARKPAGAAVPAAPEGEIAAGQPPNTAAVQRPSQAVTE